MNLSKQQLFSKVKGSIIGIAYGDAFGMPVEMWTPQKISARFQDVHEFMDGPPDNPISHSLKRGEVTDDTMNSIFVLEMLKENHLKVDSRIFLQKLRLWAKTSIKTTAVIGPSTAKAMELLDKGVPETETGKTGTTNGAAMKIIPVGLCAALAGLPDTDALVSEVEKLSMPTHNTSTAISAACAIAGGAALAASGEKDLQKIFTYMQEISILGEQRGESVISPSIADRLGIGRYLIKSYPPSKVPEMIYRCIGAGLPSSESIPAAATLFLLAQGDPLTCARYAANMGGDTDTIASMACGICGAYAGEEAFPEETVKFLEETNSISFQSLAGMLTTPPSDLDGSHY